MHKAAAIFSALSEPTRLLALSLIWGGRELCVCEIMNALKATQSRTSRHMSILKAVGLVVDRRDAQWVFYRRNPLLSKKVVELVDAALSVENLKKRKSHGM